MSRENQFDVTASVTYNGETRNLGTFDAFDGGDADSEEAIYYPGGMQQRISLGGKQTVENVTIARLYDLARDHPQMGWLMAARGKARVVVVKTSLDINGVAFGRPLVYNGTLKRVTAPNHDSESDDAARFELEITSATVTQ